MRVNASELNVRSGPGKDFRVIGKLPKGTLVDVREEHEGWSWVFADKEELAGWVATRYLTAIAEIRVAPRGLQGIIDLFGQPGSPDASGGLVILPAPLKLGWAKDTIHRFACHLKLEGHFSRVFQRIHDEGLWPHLFTYDGCYYNRPIAGGVKRSTHAWGIAIDLNKRQNELGSEGAMHPGIIRAFLEEGFFWGGHFVSRKDPMHFQYATGY